MHIQSHILRARNFDRHHTLVMADLLLLEEYAPLRRERNFGTEQERRYNIAHVRTRGTVERCIGLLKGRWLCLGAAGGTLLYTPEKVCDIIMACGILHNIAQSHRVPFDVPAQPDEPMPGEPCPAQPHLRAVQRRDNIIQRF